MFSDMVAALERGEWPDERALRSRLSLAVTKKLGVLNIPYLCWSGDPKINPPTKHLLWAALLVGDKDQFAVVVSILQAELAERAAAKKEGGTAAGEIVDAWCVELFSHVPPEGELRRKLAELIERMGERVPTIP